MELFRHETRKGRAGEYFAAHLFEAAGVEVYRVDGDFDLILNIDGELVRVEVKAASRQRDGRRSYKFHCKRRNADAYCFVALDLGLMRVFAEKEFTLRATFTVPAHEFTLAQQTTDIQALIKSYRKP